MILTICMAGLNTRFHDVGFDVPKYLLPWKDSTIIHEIIKEIMAGGGITDCLLLPNKRDRFFKDQLLESLSDLGIEERNIAYISDTNGQGHTAALGAQIASDLFGDSTRPIAFHNADTIIQNRDIKSAVEALKKRDAYIDVFPASSPAYSYVLLDHGKVTKIVEKKVISPFASSGFYAFKSIDAYLETFNHLSEREDINQSEIYIANVLQEMIDGGGDLFINELNQNTGTIVLGTPQEYGLEMAKQVMAR